MAEEAAPSSRQPPPQECTACKLWAQASSAFRNKPLERPTTEAQPSVSGASLGTGQDEHAVAAQGGVHAVPGHDCMACRVSGTAVSLGCSAFLTRQLYKKPPPVGPHRAAIIAFAGGFAALGLLRAAV